MPLHPLVGHSEARRRVAGALAQGRLPHTILVSGPPGVGKQRFALWVAQLLLCEHPGQEPCGECPPCRRVLGLGHPDLHWFVPIPRPKAGDPDKAVDEADDLLGEVMAGRRENPLWTPPDGMASHGVASARLLLRRASLTAAEGGRKVFVVGDAERLVPQESSPEAANALLKVIEEPPRQTWFFLTAADPARLLPTLRSRAAPTRLKRLADAEVRAFLSGLGLKGRDLEEKVAQAGGIIGRATGDGGAAAKGRAAARAVLDAIRTGRGDWVEQALRQAPWQARGEFSTMLAALAQELALDARSGNGGNARLEGLVTSLERVREAQEFAQGNVNPQLLLATLAADLEEALCS